METDDYVVLLHLLLIDYSRPCYRCLNREHAPAPPSGGLQLGKQWKGVPRALGKAREYNKRPGAQASPRTLT